MNLLEFELRKWIAEVKAEYDDMLLRRNKEQDVAAWVTSAKLLIARLETWLDERKERGE